MTVPQGAKVIANKYRSRCHACKTWVQAGDGASILDVNITGNWATFHVHTSPTASPCLPQPYEAADVPAQGAPTTQSSLPYGARRYNQTASTNPGHVRCSTCQHWRADHSTGACVGAFRGAPRCHCTSFTSTGTPPAPVTNTTVAPTGQTGRLAGRGTTQRLIVFSGPIHSASDGQVHHVSASNVLSLHRIDGANPPDMTVLFFGPDNKRDYHPGPKDFVIGPRFTVDEYERAAQALAIWLVQEGITR